MTYTNLYIVYLWNKLLTRQFIRLPSGLYEISIMDISYGISLCFQYVYKTYAKELMCVKYDIKYYSIVYLVLKISTKN